MPTTPWACQRACFEGDLHLAGNGERMPRTKWGRVSGMDSGNWYHEGAIADIARVRESSAQRASGEQPGF